MLIFGGSGFIGLNLINFFLKETNFKIYTTYFENKILINSKRLVKIKVDLRNGNNLQKKIFCENKFTYIIMASGKIFNFNSNKNALNNKIFDNIFIHLNCIKFSLKRNVRKFLWISSSTGYPYVKKRRYFVEKNFFDGNPSDKHAIPGWHSRYFEKTLKILSSQSKTKIIIVRPSEVFGEYDFFNYNFARSLPIFLDNLFKRKKIIYNKNFFLKKNYIYIGCLVLFIYKLLINNNVNKKFNVFNISDSENYSFNDIYFFIKKNYKLKLKKIPKIRKIFQSKAIKNFSNKKILKILNIKSINCFNTGLKNTIKWRYKKYSKIKSLEEAITNKARTSPSPKILEKN